MLTAEQIMTPEVVTIAPDATLAEAIHTILTRGVSGLPVVDTDGRLVGVITEFALLALAYDQGLERQTVEQHLTRDVIAVEAVDPVNRVADTFIVHRVRWLPVLENNRVVGLISRRDVLRALEHPAPVCTA